MDRKPTIKRRYTRYDDPYFLKSTRNSSHSGASGPNRAVTEAYECILCAETFQQPKMFPCGHTFCGPPRPCIANLMNMDNPKCPVCQADIRHLVIVNLASNYTVMAMIEEMKKAPNSTAPGSNSFNLICSDCDRLLTGNSDWIENHIGHNVRPVDIQEMRRNVWEETDMMISAIPDCASAIEQIRVIQNWLKSWSDYLKSKQITIGIMSPSELSAFSRSLKDDKTTIENQKKKLFQWAREIKQ